MRVTAFVLIGLATVAASAVPPAAASDCLSNGRPIDGTLSLSMRPGPAGGILRGYQIELAPPACAEASGLDGAPVRLERVRTVQILSTSAAGDDRLRTLIGTRITVAGYLDAPDPGRHTGDAVLANAWLVTTASTSAAGSAEATPAGIGSAALVGAPDLPVADAASPPPLRRTEIAIVGADGRRTPYHAPAPTNRADLEARLARFVTNYYLGGQNMSPDLLRGIYAGKVDYYGKPGTPVTTVVRDKLAYYGRWPTRQYSLQPGTLVIRPMSGDPSLYELTFVYDFKVASASHSTAGTGYARLRVDLAEDRGKIVRESGKVIDRY